MKIESALIIAVPEAEPLVKAVREHFDWSAAQGVPAHITILYPFIPPHEITPKTLTELRECFTHYAAFEFTLPQLRRFPQVLYLAPVPAEPFKVLTRAMVERYPDYPPYGGEFAEVTPHLTLVDSGEPDRLDAIEREFLSRHGGQLPLQAFAHEVQLIENTSGRWAARQVFALARNDLAS